MWLQVGRASREQALGLESRVDGQKKELGVEGLCPGGGGCTQPPAGVPQSPCGWSNAPGHISLPLSTHPGIGIG